MSTSTPTTMNAREFLTMWLRQADKATRERIAVMDKNLNAEDLDLEMTAAEWVDYLKRYFGSSGQPVPEWCQLLLLNFGVEEGAKVV